MQGRSNQQGSRRVVRPHNRTVAALVIAAAMLAGCASEGGEVSSSGATTRATDATSEPEGGRGWLDDGSFESDEGAAGEFDAKDDALASGAPATTMMPTPDAGTGGSGAAPSDDVGLRAGSVDDNAAWEDYLLYRQEFDELGIDVEHIEVEGRQVITVVDGDGRPVLGASVEVLDSSGAVVAELRTYADGRTLFHAPTEVDPNSQTRERYTLRVTKGDEVVEAEMGSDSTEHTVTLESSTVGSPSKIDVMFLIDTTGSMGDEIARLQANMVSVAEQVAELPGDPDVRFGMTVYRDQGDAFVTRTFDFTDDVDDFTAALREVVADGGGDIPEDLNQGLHDALTQPAWRGDDTVKMMFLVADAPPHLDYPDHPAYADDVRAAAAAGVKIVPVASSGLDDQGEYVFRQLAQITMGRFVFLTYGADGASPGDDTSHHVDDYSVLALDEMVVTFVTEELAHQTL